MWNNVLIINSYPKCAPSGRIDYMHNSMRKRSDTMLCICLTHSASHTNTNRIGSRVFLFRIRTIERYNIFNVNSKKVSVFVKQTLFECSKQFLHHRSHNGLSQTTQGNETHIRPAKDVTKLKQHILFVL